MLKLKINTNKNFSLFSVIILTLFMAKNVHFFIIAGKTGMEAAGAWILTVFFVSIYFLMLYTGNISKYRRIFFVTVALIFAPAFIAILFETRGNMYLTPEDSFLNETPFCHIVTPMTIIPYALFKTVIFPAQVSHSYASIYSMLVIWLVATFTIGRGWCSWGCFYGGWDDGASRIAKKPLLKLDPKSNRIRYFGFAMLAFVVLASLTSLTAVYCELLCPFKLITEYEQVTDMRSFIAFIMFVITFFSFVIVLPYLTRKRFQCMSFCPFGAFQSLVDKVSIYRVRIDTEKCTQCMKCVKECPTMSITEEIIKENKGKTLITCTKCGECMDICPKGAISYVFALSKTPKPSDKPAEKKGVLNKALRRALISFKEIISPRALLSFSGFTIGMILSSGFGLGTVHRLLNLFVNGSFLLK
jgi:ferredoxin